MVVNDSECADEDMTGAFDYIINIILKNILRSFPIEMAGKRIKCTGTCTFDMTFTAEETFRGSITDEELGEIARNFSSEQIIKIAKEYFNISVDETGKDNQWNYIFSLLKNWIHEEYKGDDVRKARLFSFLLPHYSKSATD